MNVNDEALRVASGVVVSADRLVGFLYLLMRDHLPVGEIEKIARECEQTIGHTLFTNGWLAEYAKNVAGRLKI